MSIKQNSFLSKKLQTIQENSEFILSSHIQSLDSVSNDIKVLEEHLKNSAISFTFIYILSTKQKREKRLKGDFYEGYSSYQIFEDHCLVFGNDSQNQRRLSYNVYVSEDELNNNHYEGYIEIENIINEGNPILISSKPLIETKAHFRLKIEEELPFFYQSLIDSLKSRKTKGVVFQYSQQYNGILAEIHERGIAE